MANYQVKCLVWIKHYIDPAFIRSWWKERLCFSNTVTTNLRYARSAWANRHHLSFTEPGYFSSVSKSAGERDECSANSHRRCSSTHCSWQSVHQMCSLWQISYRRYELKIVHPVCMRRRVKQCRDRSLTCFWLRTQLETLLLIALVGCHLRTLHRLRKCLATGACKDPLHLVKASIK